MDSPSAALSVWLVTYFSWYISFSWPNGSQIHEVLFDKAVYHLLMSILMQTDISVRTALLISRFSYGIVILFQLVLAEVFRSFVGRHWKNNCFLPSVLKCLGKWEGFMDFCRPLLHKSPLLSCAKLHKGHLQRWKTVSNSKHCLLWVAQDLLQTMKASSAWRSRDLDCY